MGCTGGLLHANQRQQTNSIIRAQPTGITALPPIQPTAHYLQSILLKYTGCEAVQCDTTGRLESVIHRAPLQRATLIV